MDGNNRWSIKNKRNQFESYLKGANRLLDISKYLFNNYDVKYISAFALSKNNLKRSESRLTSIKNVLEYFVSNQKRYSNDQFQILFKGDIGFLSNILKKKIFELQDINKNKKKKLVVYLNYSGQNDILNSAKKLVKMNIKINHINFAKNLITKNMPNPDLLIRTGGFRRISDFMLYQLYFTELFFSRKLWPDLRVKDLDKFIKDYHSIERKFGL